MGRRDPGQPISFQVSRNKSSGIIYRYIKRKKKGKQKTSEDPGNRSKCANAEFCIYSDS